jgi:plasmid maintenance system antidote protein VapI
LLPKKRPPTRLGEMLFKEFLEPMGMKVKGVETKGKEGK